MTRVISTLSFLGLLCYCVVCHAQPTLARPNVLVAQAQKWAEPTKFMMLDGIRVGSHIVVVGEHGVILLSEDGGVSFRQANSVPIDSTLTGVEFVDDKHGWAVGHWGVVLATIDGGESWKLLRLDVSTDQPLFSVHFKNNSVGWVCGLWSLLLKTEDGGTTWQKLTLQGPPDGDNADRNLYKMWADTRGTLFIAAERGSVLRSTDEGNHWLYLDTGYKGSFWTGIATPNGELYVGGLRGNLYRSADEGNSWARVDLGIASAITGLAMSGMKLVGVGLDGWWFEREVGNASFHVHQLADRSALTGIVAAPSNRFILISKTGLQAPQ